MKNITLSAPEPLIEAARQQAAAQHTTLNHEFRKWLAGFAQTDLAAQNALDAIHRIRSYTSLNGQKFSRDEMNERR
jgi:hypothetical protein